MVASCLHIESESSQEPSPVKEGKEEGQCRCTTGMLLIIKMRDTEWETCQLFNAESVVLACIVNVHHICMHIDDAGS
ncbi:hypothetical protein MTO96_022020 [Rhipicephalus appendiculatus]